MMWSTELKGVTLDNHQKASANHPSLSMHIHHALRWGGTRQSFDKPMTISIAISDLRLKVLYSHIEKVIDDRPPCIIGLATAEDMQYYKWLWPSIDSAHPSHPASELWCFYHILFWSYSLSQVKFKHSYVRKILCIIGCHPLLLPRATLSTPDFHCCSCHGHWQMHAQSRSNLILVDFTIFQSDTSISFLRLWCRYHWIVCVLSSTLVKDQCLYIAWFSR